MKCKSDIEAEKLKDLELGFYYCLVKPHEFKEKEIIEVRELECSEMSGNKLFPPKYPNEKIIAFDKIDQKPNLIKPKQKEVTLSDLTSIIKNKYEIFKP